MMPPLAVLFARIKALRFSVTRLREKSKIGFLPFHIGDQIGVSILFHTPEQRGNVAFVLHNRLELCFGDAHKLKELRFAVYGHLRLCFRVVYQQKRGDEGIRPDGQGAPVPPDKLVRLEKALGFIGV